MITIDYQSKLPLYEQIAERFQAMILRDALPPGSQMPSVRSLAMDLSINPNTIQKAFSLLEQRGYIYPVRGRGNYVADTARLAEQEKASLLKEVNNLLIQGKELGISRKEFIAVVDMLYGKEDTND
ncbi:GntR family transcriptional regulator [Mediterraneibacter catenae]|jgi:GntR family transcriptional regulator|uniref:GntR family transcriptional regulator n=1 Tax=Mediterraneibacter catenae TaxID=2594882 RepID=A0A5M9HZV9_9FIRM|nr:MULTISPECIES: GntR family transcriptional regulator [Mediterraneibacter]KAA8500445.1 GntR family transcriptional regulator [Mediterraneibacter catenae]MDN0062260.1 GntR family transcriptional regulator [Mediterraneibacter glycyrrhizinilyticus]